MLFLKSSTRIGVNLAFRAFRSRLTAITLVAGVAWVLCFDGYIPGIVNWGKI